MIVPHQWWSAIVIPVPIYPPSIVKLSPMSLTGIFAKISVGIISIKWILVHIDINQSETSMA